MNLLKDNWTYAKVTDFAQLLRGITYKKDESRKDLQEGYKPILRSNNIDYELNFVDLVYVPEKKIKTIQFIKEGDIIFAMSSGSKHLVGKSAQSTHNYDGSYGAFCGLLRVSDLMNKKLVGLFFKSQEYRKYISKISKGTNINNLKRDHILEINFPLAPLIEQNRIVKKIEELFSDLDKATEDLKKIQKQLKTYRQSTLKASFEDKIGVNRNNIKIEKIFKLGELLNGITYRKSDANNNYEIGYKPILRANNIDNNILNFRNLVFVPLSKIKSYQYIKKGDIVFCMSSGSKHLVGKSAIANLDYDGSWGAFCSVLRPNNLIIGNYLRYFFQTKKFRNYISNISKGTNINNLKKEHILEFEVPVPPKQIQEEIIKEIESRLSVCDKLEETVQQSLEKIEYLRQSILKKVFEGKLVPQDPNDEPAEKLLERIKQEKEKFESNNKKRKMR